MAINNYDPNTGRKLNAGETVVNKSTGKSVTQGTAFNSPAIPTNASTATKPNYGAIQNTINQVRDTITQITPRVQEIAAERLKTPTNISLPNQPTDTTPYSGITAGATSAIDSYTKNMNDLMSTYAATAPKPTDTSALYDQLSQEYGLDNKQDVVNEKQALVNTATNELNNINTQIQSVNDEANAAQLQLEKNAGTGSDITSAFLGRQQQEISRNAAIKSLPLQSQALAASAKVSAAQGDQQLAQDMLSQAQDKINTVFKIKSDYETQKYEYSQNLIDKVFSFATDQQKVQLQVKQQEETRSYEMFNDQMSIQQSIAKEAMAQGDYRTASKITQLDPKSLTYSQDLANLQASIQPSATSENGFSLSAGQTRFDSNGNVIASVAEKGSVSGGGGGFVQPDGEYSGLSNEAAAVISGTLSLKDLTPTTRGKISGELMAAGYKTPDKLSTAQQNDLAEMETVKSLANQIIAFNADGKLEGIGSYGTGTIKSALAQLGIGGKEGKDVRALIGNIKGTIAKLRGGTSFTTNEEKLLNTYVPDINDDPSVALNKISLLISYIDEKRVNLLKASSGELNKTQTTSNSNSVDMRTKYNY